MIINVNGIDFDLRLRTVHYSSGNNSGCVDFSISGESIGTWYPCTQSFGWHYLYGSRGRDYYKDEDVIAQPTLNLLKEACSKFWENRAFS
jgi:hypothetical protein